MLTPSGGGSCQPSCGTQLSLLFLLHLYYVTHTLICVYLCLSCYTEINVVPLLQCHRIFVHKIGIYEGN